MEVEVKEFGVRIRLIVEPDSGNNGKAKGHHEDLRVADLELEVVKDSQVKGQELQPEQAVVSRPSLERQLRNWRREEAVRRGVPTYIIMTERTIQAIVGRPPVDIEALGQLKGIGPKTMELYGETLLELIGGVEEEE